MHNINFVRGTKKPSSPKIKKCPEYVNVKLNQNERHIAKKTKPAAFSLYTLSFRLTLKLKTFTLIFARFLTLKLSLQQQRVKLPVPELGKVDLDGQSWYLH